MGKVDKLTLWPTLLCLVGNPVPKLTTSIDQITSSISNSCRIFSTSKVSFRDFSVSLHPQWACSGDDELPLAFTGDADWINEVFFFFFFNPGRLGKVALYNDAHRQLEVSRALSMSGTSASCSNCQSVWRLELDASLTHKKRQSGELLKHQKEVGKPTQSLPVRTGARLFD